MAGDGDINGRVKGNERTNVMRIYPFIHHLSSKRQCRHTQNARARLARKISNTYNKRSKPEQHQQDPTEQSG